MSVIIEPRPTPSQLPPTSVRWKLQNDTVMNTGCTFWSAPSWKAFFSGGAIPKHFSSASSYLLLRLSSRWIWLSTGSSFSFPAPTHGMEAIPWAWHHWEYGDSDHSFIVLWVRSFMLREASWADVGLLSLHLLSAQLLKWRVTQACIIASPPPPQHQCHGSQILPRRKSRP